MADVDSKVRGGKREPGWVIASMLPFYAGFLYWGYAYLVPQYESGQTSLIEAFITMGVVIAALAVLQAIIKRLGKDVARTLYGSWLVPKD